MNTKLKTKAERSKRDRRSERGAALVTVLMISFLLLVASIALILESSLNTANVTDATSEEQAYYAAESGVQSVVDALRHNPLPNPVIDATKLPLPPDPNADPANQIDYLKAVARETSNKCVRTDLSTCVGTDPGSYPDPLDRDPNALRLSRWLPYNWGPNGGASAASKDRIVLGNPNTYSPLNGYAYSVTVSDPDFTDGLVHYTVSGDLDLAVSGSQATKVFLGPTAGDSTTITYNPPPTQHVPVSSGFGTGAMGSFTVSKTGAGGTIPTGNGLWRFKLVLAKVGGQSLVFRGYVLPANMTLETETVGTNCAMNDISFLFDSQFYAAFGSRLELVNPAPLPAGTPAVCAVEERKDNSADVGQGPDGVFLAGWRELSNSVDQPLNVRLRISKPHPTRLLIRSTGYGPRGARKELESIIQKNYFDGLGAPSPLTMIGPNCTPPVGCTTDRGSTSTFTSFLFYPGNSRPVFYTGKDRRLRYFLPPIGATNDTNTQLIRTATNPSTFNGAVFGTPENILDELPSWLVSPANLHDTVLALRSRAEASGSYWLGDQSGVPVGDYTTGLGFTFIDGNLDISPSQLGGGVLVVNGKITNNGGYSFKGLILIIGKDGMQRTGGGSAVLEGNMVIAPYMSPGRRIRTALTAPVEPSLACSGPVTSPQTTALTNSCFYAPRYTISGGGGSDVMYNSQSVMNGLSGLGNFVKGVAEK